MSSSSSPSLRFHPDRPTIALLIAATASLLLVSPANSQAPQITITGEQLKPRGQRDVKDVSFGDWRKICFKPGNAKTVCRTSIAGIFPTGQMAIRLDIIERQGDSAQRIQIFSPVGMYLPSQIELTIDHGMVHRVPYTWCLTNTCIAGTKATSRLIGQMKKGHQLQLRFMDTNLLALSASLPLTSFASVHNGSPAQTFEQDIDE